MKKILIASIAALALACTVSATDVFGSIGIDTLKVSSIVNTVQGADSKANSPSDIVSTQGIKSAPLIKMSSWTESQDKKIIICKNIAATKSCSPKIGGGYSSKVGEGGV